MIYMGLCVQVIGEDNCNRLMNGMFSNAKYNGRIQCFGRATKLLAHRQALTKYRGHLFVFNVEITKRTCSSVGASIVTADATSHIDPMSYVVPMATD